MRKYLYTIGLSLLATVSFGQMSKDLTKAIQKEMKTQTPEQYVQVAQDLQAAKKQVIVLEGQLETVSS